MIFPYLSLYTCLKKTSAKKTKKTNLKHSEEVVTTCDTWFKLPIMTRGSITQNFNECHKEVVHTLSQLLNVSVEKHCMNQT